MPAKPTTIDEYLARVKPAQRAALEKVRKAIQAAAPDAEEGISYGLAAFRLDGRPLVAFGATANHCAFFPMSGTTVAALQKELAGYDTSKGTIRFAADKPLPVALVRKLVKARIAESKGKGGLARKKPTARDDLEVRTFLEKLDHPLKPVVEAVRKVILGASPAIREGIKWNSVSFRTTEYFATFHLRDRDRIRVVLHFGAKARKGPTPTVTDPAGLVEWVAKDRGLVTFRDAKEVRAKRVALTALVREWIRHV
jgi:uncharacterized protein YdhG (YjbR/CyaY superfamily)